jgi:hypothetical protein
MATCGWSNASILREGHPACRSGDLRAENPDQALEDDPHLLPPAGAQVRHRRGRLAFRATMPNASTPTATTSSCRWRKPSGAISSPK